MQDPPSRQNHDRLTSIQILEDYSSQIDGLTKELAQLQKDWAQWEQSKPLAITDGVGR